VTILKCLDRRASGPLGNQHLLHPEADGRMARVRAQMASERHVPRDDEEALATQPD
jgi:hypothetical protein